MRSYRKKLSLALVLGLLVSSAAFAVDDNAEISTKLVLGVESDSNVAVDEIDSDSAVRDSLWTFSASLNYRKDVNKDTELKLGSSHSRTIYDEFSEFDLTTNFVTADLSHDFAKFTTGATLRYIAADLDYQNFLSLSQTSLYASALVNKRMFLRVDYTYSNKQFDTFTDRDATQHSVGADLYFFLDGAKRYWVAGYKFDREDASSDQFDRDIHNIKLRYTQAFPLLGRNVIGRLKARYQTRDYGEITPSIGVVRDEQRYRFGAELEIPLSRSSFLLLEFERSDYRSNLPSADYTQNVIAFKVGWDYER